MDRGGTAPVAELFKLYLAGDEFLVFGAPVVDAFALAALEFYEAVLGHNNINLTKGLYPITPWGATTLL